MLTSETDLYSYDDNDLNFFDMKTTLLPVPLSLYVAIIYKLCRASERHSQHNIQCQLNFKLNEGCSIMELPCLK
jgi:hypothetical protein